VIDKLLAQTPPRVGKGRYQEDRLLGLLWRLTSGRGRRLVEALMARHYYKRVLEIPLSALTESGWMELRERFTEDRRAATQGAVEKALVSLVRTKVQDEIQERASLREDAVLERVDALSAERTCFVIDLPLRGWLPKGGDPRFVSDYKRRHFGLSAEEGDGGQGSTLWSEHLGPMMRSIAFFRVFCDPDMHRIVRRVLTAGEIEGAVRSVVSPLQQRKKS